MTHTHKGQPIDYRDDVQEGPPEGIMMYAQQELEDAAHVALLRTKALYDVIVGKTGYLRDVASRKRIHPIDKDIIASTAQTADEVSFLINETLAWLSRAKASLDAYHTEFDDPYKLDSVPEASKSALGRAQ